MKDLPILIEKKQHKNKYNMNKYFENVRVDLKDKKIHVPKKQKFHEVYEVQEKTWESHYITKTIFWSFYSLSIILIFISLFLHNSEFAKILNPLTASSCVVTLIITLIIRKYRTWFYTSLWVINSTIWILFTINIFIV